MSSRRLFLALVCSAVIASGSAAARAETPTENPPPVTPSALPSAPNTASCSDDRAAEARKREAALVELGKRLSAEPTPDGDYQVLNRTGQNYGSRPAER
jgi:type IV secretory pathway VirJ component